MNSSTAIARPANLMAPAAVHAPWSALSFFDRIEAAMGVWRQRRSLARLDAGRLDDIGLTPAEAAREAARPVWDVPAAWRR